MLSKNYIIKLFIDISFLFFWYILLYRCFVDVDVVSFVIFCFFDNYGDEVGFVLSLRI